MTSPSPPAERARSINLEQLFKFLTLASYDPELFVDPDKTEDSRSCIVGIGSDGIIHILRLKHILTPFIEREKDMEKPWFDLKVLFSNHRRLLANFFEDEPGLKNLASMVCDRIEEAYLQRWESKCEEMGWYDFQPPQMSEIEMLMAQARLMGAFGMSDVGDEGEKNKEEKTDER